MGIAYGAALSSSQPTDPAGWADPIIFDWTEYGTQGSGIGNFYYPYSFYYEPNSEYLYITDLGNARAVKTQIDGTGWDTYSCGYRTGIFYDSVNEFLYLVKEIGIPDPTYAIYKSKFDGSQQTTYGTYGSGVGNFNQPTGVMYIASTGYLHITDGVNNRIVKTKIDGTGWTTYGSVGSGTGNFNGPHDLWYDASTEFIYIADTVNNRIVKTKIDGSGWATYGSTGSGEGQFNLPVKVQYNNNYIFVADYDNHRIVRFRETLMAA